MSTWNILSVSRRNFLIILLFLFGVEMAGITYPDKEYLIYRKQSELFCMEYVISEQGTVSVDHQTFWA